MTDPRVLAHLYQHHHAHHDYVLADDVEFSLISERSTSSCCKRNAFSLISINIIMHHH
jgi:hypothetical protein